MPTWEEKARPLVQWLKTDREQILESEYYLAKFIPGFTIDLQKMETRDRLWHYKKLIKDKEEEAKAFENI